MSIKKKFKKYAEKKTGQAATRKEVASIRASKYKSTKTGGAATKRELDWFETLDKSL